MGPQMTGDSQLQKAGNHLLCVATNIIFLHHVAREVSEMLVQHTFNSFQPLGLCLVGSWASILFMQRTPEEGRKWIGRKLGQLNKNVAKFKPIPLKDVPALGKYIHS